MANLTGTQKKKRNQFVALLVAIVVVLAAIFYVAYSAFMAKSAFLANQDFAAGLAVAFDKSARSVSEEDLASVKYLEVYSDGEMGAIGIGGDEFAAKYDEYLAQLEAAEIAEEAGVEDVPEVAPIDASSLAYAEFEVGDEVVALSDVKYFTGAEYVAFSGVDFNAEDLGGFKNLKRANFSGCGITNEELAAFAGGLNLENVEELVFMGSSVDDWSPVESISDKVIIQNYGLQMTEDGQYTIVPTEQTLTEYLAAQAEAEAEAEAAEEETAPEAEGEVSEEVTEEAETVEETTETAEVTE